MNIFELELFGLTISPSYYGLMYAISFIIGYTILSKNKTIIKSKINIDNLFIFIFAGVILGGRLGYILLGYGSNTLDYYIYNPIKLIATWDGGMSFHGGLIGVILSVLLFSRIYKIKFFKIMDHIAIVVTIGLFFGRIGNYINQELLGYYPYYGPLATLKDGTSYFPSTLLEAFLEGIVLYFILNYLYKKIYLDTYISNFKNTNSVKYGIISGVFLLFYGIFRFSIEFVRLPDAHIGYLYGTDWITKGQVFSLPMIVIGFILIVYFIRSKKK